MLAGDEESKTVFDNIFRDSSNGEIMKKTSEAKYAFAFKWGKMCFAIWRDGNLALWFVTEKLPKDAKNIYTLTKKDSSINYQMISRTSDLMKLLSKMYEIGALRYESAHAREAFFEILSFIGIK